MKIKAEPKFLALRETEGYILRIEITSGPQHMVGRTVDVVLTAKQLDTIGEWNPDDVRHLDLGPAGLAQTFPPHEHELGESGA